MANLPPLATGAEAMLEGAPGPSGRFRRRLGGYPADPFLLKRVRAAPDTFLALR
jgi:hypothetical protein